MRKLGIMLAAGATVLLASLGITQAQFMFDPAVHHLEDMEPLVLGSKDNNFHMEPKEYRLKVGQGYRWKIVASDLTEYAFVAPEFVRNIWIRKIEAGDPEIEIKAVTFDELEFENGGEVEVFFVAVRPGTYEFGPKGLMERGMVGKIIVEQAGSGPAATTPAAKKATDHDDDEDDR